MKALDTDACTQTAAETLTIIPGKKKHRIGISTNTELGIR